MQERYMDGQKYITFLALSCAVHASALHCEVQLESVSFISLQMLR